MDVVLGLQARYNIRDVLDGLVELRDIIVEGPFGIKVIPTGSGIASLSQLSLVQKEALADQLRNVEEDFDLILVDCGAGIADNVTHLSVAADQLVIVTTPEPHALTDAYALIKVLAEHHNHKNFNVLVNQCRTAAEGKNVFDRLNEVAKRFLSIEVVYLGHVPIDPQIPRAVIQQQAASERSSTTLAGQAWTQIAHKLVAEPSGRPAGEEFWRSILWSQPPAAAFAQL